MDKDTLPMVDVCVAFEVVGCTKQIESIGDGIREAFPLITKPKKLGGLPLHMTIFTGQVPVWDLQMAVARVMAQVLPFSRGILPVLGSVALTPTAECVWLRLLFDRARGKSSFIITGDRELNWRIAKVLGAPDTFTFSLPSHITKVDLVDQARRYGNADVLSKWLSQYERDNADLLLQISQTMELIPRIYIRLPGGVWMQYAG